MYVCTLMYNYNLQLSIPDPLLFCFLETVPPYHQSIV